MVKSRSHAIARGMQEWIDVIEHVIVQRRRDVEQLKEIALRGISARRVST